MINKGYANKIIAYDDNTVAMYIKPEFVKDVFKNDYKKVGRNPRHFTIRSCPAGSNDEKTIYSYEFDKKGNPSRMICQTTYAGGQANYYPYTRNISVSFE